MRTTYRVLAWLIAAEVIIQVAAIAYAIYGLNRYINDGNVVDEATRESGHGFDGASGFLVHVINGSTVVPALALALVVVSFFAQVVSGVKWAAIVLAAVALQVTLGIFAHVVTFLGAVHGVNALAVFALAVIAARRARSVPVASDATSLLDRAAS